MSSSYRLSVVVGTLNRLDLLKRAVDSILRETTMPVRVYVADAGSTDGTVEYLQSIASDVVRPVLAGRKLGQARAYNDVFKTIETPYVAWLSDDNEVVNHGLDVAVGALDRDPLIGMVGLKVKDLQGPYVKVPYIGGISTIGILNVNQGLLRTAVLRDVGYFSETFGFYGIDPDLTAKVLFSGHDVVYTKRIAVQHYRNWAEDPESAEYAALRQSQDRSLRLYEQKYVPLLPKDLVWSTRSALWDATRKRLGRHFVINSPRSFLWATPRDWHNIFMARYISLLDPLLHRDKDYHLRQRVRPEKRPASIPEQHTLLPQ